jgi:hypothetical protein
MLGCLHSISYVAEFEQGLDRHRPPAMEHPHSRLHARRQTEGKPAAKPSAAQVA